MNDSRWQVISDTDNTITSIIFACLSAAVHCFSYFKQEIRSMECVSAQCVAFRMPKQVVIYWGRNLQRCKQFSTYGGGPKILKVGHWSRDPFTTLLDLILHFFVRTPSGQSGAKFEVSIFNRSWDMKGSQNSKSRSRDPFATAFGLILHFLLRIPSGQSACHIWSF